jgi:hypothetical protein
MYATRSSTSTISAVNDQPVDEVSRRKFSESSQVAGARLVQTLDVERHAGAALACTQASGDAAVEQVDRHGAADHEALKARRVN